MTKFVTLTGETSRDGDKVYWKISGEAYSVREDEWVIVFPDVPLTKGLRMKLTDEGFSPVGYVAPQTI